MDIYDILFASLISIAMLFAFTKRYGLLGQFIAGAVFIISIVVGLIYPANTFKLVLDIIAFGLVLVEIILKKYKVQTNMQRGAGAMAAGVVVVILGGMRLDVPAGFIYTAAGCLLIAQGIYYFLQYHKKARNLSGVL